MLKGEQSGLWTRMAMESGSLFAPMKCLTAFTELEAAVYIQPTC
jgi:hypothetical protein